MRFVVFKSGLEYIALKNLFLRLGITTKPVQYTFGIGYEIGRQESAIKLHPIHNLQRGLNALSILHGDHTIPPNFFHRVSHQFAEHYVIMGSDGGDLIAAASTLGVPHPTGYPTYTLLARLALLFPIRALAYRTNVLSAVFAAGAVAATTHIIDHLLPQSRHRPIPVTAYGVGRR